MRVAMVLICFCLVSCADPPRPVQTSPISASRASSTDVAYMKDLSSFFVGIDESTRAIGKGLLDSETHRSLVDNRTWRLAMYGHIDRLRKSARGTKLLIHKSTLLDTFDAKSHRMADESLAFADSVNRWLKSKNDADLIPATSHLMQSQELAHEASSELAAVRDTVAAGG